MTKEEALKLALEALDTVMWHGGGSCWIVDADKIEKAIAAIKEALTQPDAFEQGRQEGMKQERALWELSRMGQEIEAQPEQEPVAYLVTGPYEKQAFSSIDSANSYCNGLNKGFGETAYSVSPLYTTPPKRPWALLTKEEIDSALSKYQNWYEFAQHLENILKGKNA